MEMPVLFTQFPVTGNTDRSVYITVIVIAGVIVIGALIAGLFKKKK